MELATGEASHMYPVEGNSGKLADHAGPNTEIFFDRGRHLTQHAVLNLYRDDLENERY